MARADRVRRTRRHATGAPVARHGRMSRKGNPAAGRPRSFGSGKIRRTAFVPLSTRDSGSTGNRQVTTATPPRGRCELPGRRVSPGWSLLVRYWGPWADTRLAGMCQPKGTAHAGDWSWHRCRGHTGTPESRLRPRHRIAGEADPTQARRGGWGHDSLLLSSGVLKSDWKSHRGKSAGMASRAKLGLAARFPLRGRDNFLFRAAAQVFTAVPHDRHDECPVVSPEFGNPCAKGRRFADLFGHFRR